jgi:hypothetical protein
VLWVPIHRNKRCIKGSCHSELGGPRPLPPRDGAETGEAREMSRSRVGNPPRTFLRAEAAGRVDLPLE